MWMGDTRRGLRACFAVVVLPSFHWHSSMTFSSDSARAANSAGLCEYLAHRDALQAARNIAPG